MSTPGMSHARDRAGELSRVADWQRIYDTLYAAAGTDGDDFTGWTSSYDGTPIPVAQMREWCDTTASLVLSLRPRRVLEVGVGTGLLLRRIAPQVEHYLGIDLSAVVVDALRARVDADPVLASRTTVRCLAAHDLGAVGAEVGAGAATADRGPLFDTVILNSVVQYFPSLDYFHGVLGGLLDLVAPGGRIFLGDLRNPRLADCLRTAVALRRAAPGSTGTQIAQAVATAAERERELLIDPDLITPAGLPPVLADRIAAADVRVKRGRADNELTRYRYDVVLTTCPAPAGTSLRGTASAGGGALLPPAVEAPALEWGWEVDSLDELAGHLAAHRPDRLRVLGVPHARLFPELAAMRALAAGAGAAAARAVLDDPLPRSVPGVEDLAALGAAHGYDVVPTFSPDGGDGDLDVLFRAAASPDPDHRWPTNGVDDPAADRRART
ncbi:class I SAM-dependent methyltransferase [Parafrankia elaeagni]|uniref:class I SAM-dependent methyltransferase n=1 Tax=Parafrankia elaeagni TaxID=222534 RepID=UPI0003AA5218|nr:class I SAM-dependent methyltransferase [Parafrankia elaeagni]